MSPAGGGRLPRRNKSAGRPDDGNCKDISPKPQKGYVFFLRFPHENRRDAEAADILYTAGLSAGQMKKGEKNENKKHR